MLPAVQAAGFQVKNGAAFACGDAYTYFDFRDKFTAGPCCPPSRPRASRSRTAPRSPAATPTRTSTSATS
ncbi:hypothetical protein CTI14_71850, partial [Methylobacterium radiotolerans]